MNRAWWPLISLVLLGGCNQSDFDTDPTETNPDGPGTPQWGNVDVTCQNDDACNYGEACVAGVCQMKRCGKEYESAAPLGNRRALLIDREIVVADGTSTRGFLPTGSTMSAASNAVWSAGGTSISDVGGGALLADGPELAVVARTGSSSVFVPKINKTISTGFVPVAITTGDVDHDGLDEVIALGGAGQISICNVDDATCSRYDLEAGTIGFDVAAGDVDGDGIDEVVLHLERGGQRVVTVWNLDAEVTGQPGAYQVASGVYMGLAVSDVNADGRAEIFALEDGGWLGWADDSLVTFSANGSAVARGASIDVASNSVDITGGDLDRDKQGELIVLSSDKIARVYRGANLALAYQATLSSAGSPLRIAAVDFDGDSSIGRLMTGPELVSGEVVPTTVMYMPPYFESVSSGRPSVFLGKATSSGEARTDSVGLSVGVTVGFGGEIPGIIGAEIALELETEATYSKTFSRLITVANRFSVEADPTLYGADSAAVALSCGCFHSYTYELQSPVAGGNGQKMVVLVPVGGQTLLWSSKRYNAMAKAVGNLPVIEVPSRVGDARSYPTSPKRADGSAIPAADLVFTSAPAIRVSDVASVEWSLLAEQSQTNSTAMETKVGVNASVTVVGVMLGGSVGLSWEQGYEVSVGSALELGGSVPPIADNPNTPEDEYTAYAYGFQPAVYRQPYTTKDGGKAAYYVVNYAVDF